MATKKRRKLKNLNVEYVSFVDRGANQKVFYLTKELEEKHNEPDFEFKVRLVCSDKEDERKVYGIVYAPDTVDAHGDYTDEESLEKAAHNYLMNYRKMDTQHNLVDGAGEVVESYIAPVDFSINGEDVKKGTWILVSKASEEVWDKIKKGEITAYSLYGTAEMEYERVGLLELIGDFFGKSKDKKYTHNLSNMEVIMDEELKKALEKINEISARVEKLENIEKLLENLPGIEDLSKSVTSVIESIDSVKKFTEGISQDELKKSFEDVIKKLDGISESIANGVIGKSADKSDENEESEPKQRML